MSPAQANYVEALMPRAGLVWPIEIAAEFVAFGPVGVTDCGLGAAHIGVLRRAFLNAGRGFVVCGNIVGRNCLAGLVPALVSGALLTGSEGVGLHGGIILKGRWACHPAIRA